MIFNQMNTLFACALALLAGTVSCASPSRSTPAPQPRPVASDSLPNHVKWVRGSAEYRALTREIYAMAGDRLPELVRGLPAQSWAVILDADETVLDNSE